jgi:hypothetical protein
MCLRKVPLVALLSDDDDDAAMIGSSKMARARVASNLALEFLVGMTTTTTKIWMSRLRFVT